MSEARRKRPWWQWVLAAFAALLVLGAIFGEDDKDPAPVAARPPAATATAPPAVGSSAAPAPTIAQARAAVDSGDYAEAVSLAGAIRPSAGEAIRLRIANRIARNALSSVAAGDVGQARARLRQADRFPTTALTREARASFRAAKVRVATRARLRREAAARRRRAAAAERTARQRAAREQAATACDPSYEGACLNPSSPDYDCAGGSGDGPDYTGTVQVVGEDRFDLDRDGDGTGCD